MRNESSSGGGRSSSPTRAEVADRLELPLMTNQDSKEIAFDLGPLNQQEAVMAVSAPLTGAVTPSVLRQVLAHHPAGVCVLTTRHLGVDRGITVSTLTPVSLAPPLVLVSIGKSTRFHAAVASSGRWTASMMSNAGADLARRFSDDTRDPATEFVGLTYTRNRATGHIVFDDVTAQLECVVRAEHDSGDHTLFVSEVTHTVVHDQHAAALVHFRGSLKPLT